MLRCVSPRRPWAEDRPWDEGETGSVAADCAADLVKTGMFEKV